MKDKWSRKELEKANKEIKTEIVPTQNDPEQGEEREKKKDTFTTKLRKRKIEEIFSKQQTWFDENYDEEAMSEQQSTGTYGLAIQKQIKRSNEY